jgi:hypothetical protein
MVACCGPQVPLDVDEAAPVAVQHLVVPGHAYPVKIALLDHDRHHTEIIDEPRDYINNLLTFNSFQCTQEESRERSSQAVVQD